MSAFIKKYAIHILAITAFNPKHFELPFDLPQERNAVIICTGRENEYFKNYEGNKLDVAFLDVEDPRVPVCNKSQIYEIFL